MGGAGRRVLGDGSKRFTEIRRALGSISQRMLTLTLRGHGGITPHRDPDRSAAYRLTS
jgi:hypothetical protein